MLRVETVLKGANFLARAPGREFGGDTLAAIKTAQGRLNADPRMDLLAETPLKRDGLVNPAGPTETATRKLAAGVLAERDPMTLEPVAQPRVPEPRPPEPRTPRP